MSKVLGVATETFVSPAIEIVGLPELTGYVLDAPLRVI